MRLFTAFDVPEAVRTSLASLQDEGTLGARWTSPRQFHVTLRFIGEATEQKAKDFEDTLSDIEAAPVRCEPYGLDVLPSRQSPSVLMLGLERTDALLALYQDVSEALEAHGLAPEERAYRPHVTIARLDDPKPEAVHSFLRSYDDFSLEPFTIDSFHLYESTLTPEGAIHDRRATFPLEL